jgi:Mn2+/Fe2+ NRAMP family transporter
MKASRLSPVTGSNHTPCNCSPTIKALVWSAIINGITVAPVMCFAMLMASRHKVIGEFTLPLSRKVLAG